jgi:hypothetical protein
MKKPIQSFEWECEGRSWRIEEYSGVWFALRLLKNGELGVCVGRSYKKEWEEARLDLERDIQMWQMRRKRK